MPSTASAAIVLDLRAMVFHSIFPTDSIRKVDQGIAFQVNLIGRNSGHGLVTVQPPPVPPAAASPPGRPWRATIGSGDNPRDAEQGAPQCPRSRPYTPGRSSTPAA